MFFLHTPSSECIKSKLDLFSLPLTQTSIESSQWIYYKLYYKLYYKRNFARGRFAHKIRHTRRRLSGPHSHDVESSHTRRKQTRGEHIGCIRRRDKSRPRKSFTAFHIQPNRRIHSVKKVPGIGQ